MSRVTCSKGHTFVIGPVVLPVEVRAQIVPCPVVVDMSNGTVCSGRVVWVNTVSLVDKKCVV